MTTRSWRWDFVMGIIELRNTIHWLEFIDRKVCNVTVTICDTVSSALEHWAHWGGMCPLEIF